MTPIFSKLYQENLVTGSLKSYLAEMVGTFAWVFAGAGVVCLEGATGKVGLTGVALANGLTVTAMAFAWGRASGAHFNPALTAALFLHQRIDAVRAVFYVAAQLLGAALAGLLLSAIWEARPELASAPPFLGGCVLSGIGFKAGTLLEALGTFFLVSAYYAAYVDNRAPGPAAPLALGAAVGAGVFMAGLLTGGALNPARAFGPSIVTGQWTHWYVYWIGPLAGAVAASAIYETLYLQSTKE